MPRYRALVSTFKSTEQPIDRITNSIYFDDAGLTTDADGLAQDIATLFATYRSLPNGWDRVNVRMYDMAEPTPREIQGEFTHTATTATPDAVGPREVACCLSFHGDRNLPRSRGRIYIGPWWAAQCQERPGSGVIADLQVLRQGLADIGGADVNWCVFSPTRTGASSTPVFEQVQGGWVDNEWDTVRSRGLRASARNPYTMEG